MKKPNCTAPSVAHYLEACSRAADMMPNQHTFHGILPDGTEVNVTIIPPEPEALHGKWGDKKTRAKRREPVHCIQCDGPVFGERDEFGRPCSATDGDFCIWSDTRTIYPPKRKGK